MGDVTYRGNMNKEMRLVDMEDGTWCERVEAYPPIKLMTDGNGPYSRIRIELVIGGTEGGTFNTALPILKTNTMSTALSYTPQVTMNTGGTHTGGTVVDLLTAVSGANAQKSVASSASENLPQGFPAVTYYIRLINTDGNTANGIFRTRWEERP